MSETPKVRVSAPVSGTAWTFPMYAAATAMAVRDYRNHRVGQVAFNLLAEVRPDIAEVVRGSSFDPFHAATVEALSRFFTEVEARWSPHV